MMNVTCVFSFIPATQTWKFLTSHCNLLFKSSAKLLLTFVYPKSSYYVEPYFVKCLGQFCTSGKF